MARRAAKTEQRSLVNSLVPSFARVNLLLVLDRANVHVSAAIINDEQVCSTTRRVKVSESFAVMQSSQLRVSPCFFSDERFVFTWIVTFQR